MAGNIELCRECATDRLLVQKRFDSSKELFFLREAKMLHAVRGFSGAPSLYFAWREPDGKGLIGREHVTGKRMDDPGLPKPEVEKALRRAIKELHDNFGVAHGDISPNNILFRENPGKGLDAILLDWEFARSFREESLSSYENFRGSLGFTDLEKGLRARDEHALNACLARLTVDPVAGKQLGATLHWWKKWI
jgi:serine/threonine protein kinase